jgi:purine-nucleoside/S-methyl-5'-thioadenosine phosphorylase / adenosine deaminase
VRTAAHTNGFARAPSTTHGWPAVERITESGADDGVPVLVHPGWKDRYPWLCQGTTWRGPDCDFDLGLFGATPVGLVVGRWRLLRDSLGFDGTVHARQVHGTRIVAHTDTLNGLLITDGADGHITGIPSILLTVSIADCIPVSIIDPERRAIALVHAGWRGVAGGMIEKGVAALQAGGSNPRDLEMHLGPAICGECYEVGPEVHEQLGLPVPDRNTPVDIRAAAFERALGAGVKPDAITRSTLCTRCHADRLFSHRAGSPGRQMGILGIRPDPA